MAISSSQLRAIKTQLNSRLKPLVAPLSNAINMLPISNTQKSQLKNYPATFFMDTWVKNIMGDPIARSLLNDVYKKTGKKTVRGARVVYKYGDPAMLTRMQVLFVAAQYPNQLIAAIKKRSGLGNLGRGPLGNLGCGGGLGCVTGVDTVICIAVIGLIGTIGAALIGVLGPLIIGIVMEMMKPAPEAAPAQIGPTQTQQLPGGPGPSFGPTFDTGEGPPVALIVGGTAVAGLAAWFFLGKKKKRRR